MDIWLIKIGESLPIEEASRLFRVGTLASLLASRGHTVTWWTSTYDHFQKKQYRLSNTIIPIAKNYNLHMLYVAGYQKNASFRRLLHDYQFARQFSAHSRTAKQPDLIFVSYPTPDLAKIAVDYASYHSIPIIVDIRDLWPDALLDLLPPIIQPMTRLASIIFDWYNHRIFERATGIVAISSIYLEWGLRYARRRRRSGDAVFYMGYPKKDIPSSLKQDAQEKWGEWNLDSSKLICCFFGNIGRHFDFHSIINAAKKLVYVEDDRFVFVICGKGSHLSYYQQLAIDFPNIIFPGWVDYPQIVTLMEISAIGLAPYATNAKMSLPNKPFEYFSGGLPVLSSLRGELELILAENDCGLTYESNASAFLKALYSLADNPERRKRMGKNALHLFEHRFSAKVVYSDMIKFIETFV